MDRFIAIGGKFGWGLKHQVLPGDRMTSLSLSHTQITDTALKGLKSLPDLEYVAFADTQITDDGARRFGDGGGPLGGESVTNE